MNLLFLISLFSVVWCGQELGFKDSNVIQLQGKHTVKMFTHSSQVRAIYFYKRAVNNYLFFREDYKLAAKALDAYGVTLGFCDCKEEANKDVEYCNIMGIENGIHIYRSGNELLFVELQKLYHVHSIVSKILHVVLLKDVPVLNSEKDVSKYVSDQMGKKDILLTYLPDLGTYEHRKFLETAYKYKDKLQFVITTDRQATKMFGDPDRLIKAVPTMWWIWASDSSLNSVRYRWKFNLEEMSKFANTITKPKLFDIPGDGLDHPFSSFEVPVVKFYYNAASKTLVYREANILIQYFGGSVGIVLINMDDEEAKSKYLVKNELPTFSFQQNAETEESFVPASVTTTSVLNFVGDEMQEKPISEYTEGGLEEKVEDTEDPPYNHDEVSEQDDAVAKVVYTTRKIEMPLDLVPALTDKTFLRLVKDSETAVVLFYFPFDARSMGNLRMFGEAADKLGQQTTLKIARVNCYDYTDVCGKEKINIYPTLRIYHKGERVKDYSGPQDIQAMYSMLKLLELSPPVYETDIDNLMKYLVGGEGTLTGVTNTTVVGLFSKKDKQEKKVFQELAKTSRDRIMFVYTDIGDADKIAKKFSASVPAVILSKYDDAIQPYAKFDGKFNLQNLKEFVDNNKLPKLTVLTPLMLPELRRRFSDLLILFTDGSDSSRQSEDIVREIVKAQQFKNVSFNMMQVPDDHSVGYRVLEKYTSTPEIPHLSFVKFQKGEVFNFATAAVDKTSLTDWLSNILTGEVEPSTKLLEEEWKPRNKGFEFLKILEWEKRNPERAGLDPQTGAVVEVPDDETTGDDNEEGPTNDASEHTKAHHQMLPGRSSHHSLKADPMNRGGNSNDEGYSSDGETHESVELSDEENSSKEVNDAKHGHTEL